MNHGTLKQWRSIVEHSKLLGKRGAYFSQPKVQFPSLNLGCLMSSAISLHRFTGCLQLSLINFLYLCYHSAVSSKNGLDIMMISQISNSRISSPIWCASTLLILPQFRDLSKLTKPFKMRRPRSLSVSVAVKPRGFFQAMEIFGASLKIIT